MYLIICSFVSGHTVVAIFKSITLVIQMGNLRSSDEECCRVCWFQGFERVVKTKLVCTRKSIRFLFLFSTKTGGWCHNQLTVGSS